jgi:putative peptidoglycan lipid II flippase
MAGMVGKIIKLFSKVNGEISGVHQAAFLIGFFTLLAQILGLIRDRSLAHFFGAGLQLDIYYAAFRIPDLIFATAASLVSISVIIPFINKAEGKYVDAKEDAGNRSGTSGEGEVNIDTDLGKKANTEVRNIVDSLFSSFSMLMIVISVIAYALMPFLIDKIFKGITDPAAIAQVIKLSRILLLQPICLGISNILGSLTQLRKRFVLYALSPIFYNIAIIAGIFLLRPMLGISGVVWGVIIGGVLHFAIQIPFIKKEELFPRLRSWKKIDWKLVREVFKLSVPRTLTLSAAMIELVVLTALAATLATGSISILSLSFNIQSVPLGIIGVSYALAAFPTLSAFFARGEKDKFLAQMATAIRHVIFWSVPIAAFFIVLRAQIVRTILGSGNFNWDNTRLTAACLALFTISLVAQALELLFIRAYYAAGQTRKPLIINLVSSVVTIASPILFIMLYRHDPEFGNFFARLFRVEGIPGVEILMLPLGYTLGTLFNALAFWIKFEKDFSHGELLRVTWRSWMGSLGAGIIGGFFAYIGLNMFDRVFDLNTVLGVFLHGFVAGIIGVIFSIIVLKILRNEEFEEVIATLHRKVPAVAIFGSWFGKKATPADLTKTGDVLVLEADKMEH